MTTTNDTDTGTWSKCSVCRAVAKVDENSHCAKCLAEYRAYWEAAAKKDTTHGEYDAPHAWGDEPAATATPREGEKTMGNTNDTDAGTWAIRTLGKRAARRIFDETYRDLKRAGFGKAQCQKGAEAMVIDQAEALEMYQDRRAWRLTV